MHSYQKEKNKIFDESRKEVVDRLRDAFLSLKEAVQGAVVAFSQLTKNLGVYCGWDVLNYLDVLEKLGYIKQTTSDYTFGQHRKYRLNVDAMYIPDWEELKFITHLKTEQKTMRKEPHKNTCPKCGGKLKDLFTSTYCDNCGG